MTTMKVSNTLEIKMFANDREAEPCNSPVDGKIPALDFAIVPDSDKTDELHYQAGLLRTLFTLEVGLPANMVPE